MDSSSSDRRDVRRLLEPTRTAPDVLPQRAWTGSKNNREYTVRALSNTWSHSIVSLSDSSESDNISLPSEDVPHSLDKLTPPPNDLRRHLSGLPPTPPTVINGEPCTMESRGEHALAPVYADRMRNALDPNKKSPSTPTLEAHSPPTPDPSPPGPRKRLAAPPLVSAYSASSRAESFRTAKEEIHPSSDVDVSRPPSISTPRHDIAGTLEILPVAVTVPEKASSGRPQGPDRLPSYVSSSSGRQVRAKHYQVDSDSDVGGDPIFPANSFRLSPNGRTPSPAVQRAMAHRAALQQLRDTVRSGAVMSMSQSVPYTIPSERIKSRHAEWPGVATTPRTQQAKDPMPCVPDPVSEYAPVRDPPARSVHKATLEQLSGEPPLASPTPTAMALLEKNNHVYKFIQEENAKRHSGASDGSLQVMVMSSPEAKRSLRHSPKRQSLRADLGVGDQSPPVDATASHTLRHKRGFSDEFQPVSQDSPIALHPTHQDQDRDARLLTKMPGPRAEIEVRKTRAAERNKGLSDLQSATPSQQHRLRRTSREQDLGHSARTVSGPARLTGPTLIGAPSFGSHRARDDVLTENPKLRKSSNEQRLENNLDVRRTALERLPLRSVSNDSETLAEELFRMHARTASSPSIPRRSLDRSLLSPGRRSSDTRFLHSSTPHSIGQISDRTVELCEARGVEMFPHSNNSLLVVQQSIRPSGRTGLGFSENADAQRSLDAARLSPDDQLEHSLKQAHTVIDSPLTNPREAPLPPTINYIPPTPSAELDLMFGTAPSSTKIQNSNSIQRKLSLKQKVRRYSENFIQPLTFSRTGSLRKQAPSRAASVREEARPTYLSSMWTPRDFWEEYDSDDSYDDVYEDHEGHDVLPPGGDTSDVPDIEERRRTRLFPRNLSVRMPGFRGDGGFLIGNSLGIDRHGTNRRRHYVTVTHRRSARELTGAEKTRRRALLIPPTTRARLKNMARNILMTKAERERAQRLLDLKTSIGPVITQT